MAKVIFSVVICTYNRYESLKRALESLEKLNYDSEQFEVVIVDNNSNDGTGNIKQEYGCKFKNFSYVVEKNLSFTIARKTGAEISKGEILCYIDDDVTVTPDWLTEIENTFNLDSQIGIVGGRILPIYETKPFPWALVFQSKFNGWSLWDYDVKDVESPGACGPNFCIKREIFFKVGGFPPDTIGVESDTKSGTIEKIYIGDGDAGLNKKVKYLGYKLFYSHKGLVYHHIPPVRMTCDWWQRRLNGEAYMLGIVNFYRERIKSSLAYEKRLLWTTFYDILKYCYKFFFNFWGKKALARFYYFQIKAHIEKLRLLYTLYKKPLISEKLWEAGLKGVQGDELRELMREIPK